MQKARGRTSPQYLCSTAYERSLTPHPIICLYNGKLEQSQGSKPYSKDELPLLDYIIKELK